MPPPDNAPGPADMSYTSPDVFKNFAGDTRANNTAFDNSTADARNQATGASGQLSGSEALLRQLAEASVLRKTFIEETSNGLKGYASAGDSMYSLHTQHASVTTVVMQKLMKLEPEGGK
ncbi:hypothetical protein [Kribbella sindirgiensis]|uniref:Uncharacterized protein n=1 Tax=Kribbella sindirgiensis TaxID=1124744 RepID=A0A4R0I203_9ACTN|nr:hypothetical protein [Kribbella sindirgiensis]TCC22335.1 hypothetical protein E0H50_34730 [Kribbella sindirgiensis]